MRPGSEGVKRQGHPFICPGIEAALYQLSTTMDSLSSLFTKWKQMNSIKHKTPELQLPLYLVVKEFIHNWHMIFSSGFKLFPNVKRNLSVWERDGFVSNQSIMLSKGKEGGSAEWNQAGHGLCCFNWADGSRCGSVRREAQTLLWAVWWFWERDSVTFGMQSHWLTHICHCICHWTMRYRGKSSPFLRSGSTNTEKHHLL